MLLGTIWFRLNLFKIVSVVGKQTSPLAYLIIKLIASGLAYYLCLKKNVQKAPLIKQQYEQDLQNALKYDEDRSSVRIVPKQQYI